MSNALAMSFIIARAINQSRKSPHIHIGADAESGLIRTGRSLSGHVSDIAEANTVPLGKKTLAFCDAV